MAFGMKDGLNQIEEAILDKVQQRVHSRSTEETFLAKQLRHYALEEGYLNLQQFSRALVPFAAGIGEKDIAAIFERYAEGGMLPIRQFSAEFTSGVPGTRPADEVLQEFAETLKDHIAYRRGQRSYPTHLVAWEEFEDYFKSICGCFSEGEFCSIVEKVWDLNKAKDASVEQRTALARPAAGAPLKVRTGLHHWQTNTLPTTMTHHKIDEISKIEDVMKRARAQIARRSLRAAVDVVQHFYTADDDVDDQLDQYEFRQACRKAQLSFREPEEVSIFEACAETKGKVHLPTFLKLLHGELSAERRALVERAFAAVGGNPQDNSAVSPGVLKERFVAKAHPLVARGQLQPGFVLAEFLDTFSQLAHVLGGCENGMVSFSDFLAYYEVVSSTVENDSLFDLIVQRVWDVPKDGGESPRRALHAPRETCTSPWRDARPPPHSHGAVTTSAYAAADSPKGAPEHYRRFGRGQDQPSAITRGELASVVFNDKAHSPVSEVIARLRKSIALRGLKGWNAIVKHFHFYDYKKNGTIMRLDWQRLNKTMGLGVSPEEQNLLFQDFSQRKKGISMDYNQLLELLRGELPEERANAVAHLFQALGDGAVSPDQLKSRFDARSAPQCLLRRKDPRQAEQEFFEAVDFFSEGKPFDFDKFSEFFQMISAVHEDDDEFRLHVSSAFDVK
ncbi:unnamed protein product [Effrenium voratum]|uniref:Uncharacterized protein n=1 Tax=Effrenium voratum TaxID=2562239 RepID=A0AA36NKH7_9DINO|nr:unnamed protein product [Effrenium voratum]